MKSIPVFLLPQEVQGGQHSPIVTAVDSGCVLSAWGTVGGEEKRTMLRRCTEEWKMKIWKCMEKERWRGGVWKWQRRGGWTRGRVEERDKKIFVCEQGGRREWQKWITLDALDVTFALGALTCLGSRLPSQSKIPIEAICTLSYDNTHTHTHTGRPIRLYHHEEKEEWPY